MNKNILSEISRMKEIMGLINEQVVTDYDSSYDYKKENGKYYTRKKGSNNWIEAKGSSLNSIKSKVFKDSSYSRETPSIKDYGYSINDYNTTDIPFKNKQEGDKFRKWVNDNYPDYAKQIDLDISGSHTNSYIIKAWNKYGNEYKKGKSSTETNSEEPKNHFVFYFSFPEYEPRYDNKNGWFEQALDWARAKTPEGLSSFLGKEGTYGAMGHAGVALINPQGKIYIFEFGRYAGSGKGMGIVKSKVVSGAKIENGVVKNLQDVCSIVKNNAQGQAKNYKMQGVAVPITQEGFNQGISAAKSKSQKPYEIFDFDTGDEDSNCATFGLEIVRTATGSGNEYCLPNPSAGLRVVQTYKGSQTTEC